MEVQVFAAVALSLAMHSQAAPPAHLSGPRALPSHFDELLAPASVLQSSAPAADDAELRLVRKLEYEDLQLTGFVASRSAQDAPDYRVYVGLGHESRLGSLATLTSRAFYGTGTYEGASPDGLALPEEVRSGSGESGGWLGADWKVESTLTPRYTFAANVEYRQRVALQLGDLQGLIGLAPTAAEPVPTERKVGLVTNNIVALSQDLALKVRMRYGEDTHAAPTGSAVDPRVELLYRPEQNATLSAVFDQTANAPLSAQRAYHPWASTETSSDRIRNYELAYEKALWDRNKVRLAAYRYDVNGLLTQPLSPATPAEAASGSIDTTGFELGMERTGFGGARTRVSYAWQETADWPGTATSGSLGQHLTKLSVDIPLLPKRLTTSFELQHLDVVGSLLGDQQRDFLVGNLTLAGTALASDTRVTFGMHNLFGARETASGARLLSFIPPDGRSLRLDVMRKL